MSDLYCQVCDELCGHTNEFHIIAAILTAGMTAAKANQKHDPWSVSEVVANYNQIIQELKK